MTVRENRSQPSACLLDFHLDILGQQSRINKLYTQITFCYSLTSIGLEISQTAIIDKLKCGFQRLVTSFPWIAGRVVEEEGNFIIRVLPDDTLVFVKDYTNDSSIPDWTSLQQRNFPFSMLDESFVAPCKTLEDSSEKFPVFTIQANFIRGAGLLLTFSGQHGSMDMAGQTQIMYLFAKACRNEAFTKEEISIGNMDRRTIIPLLDDALCDFQPRKSSEDQPTSDKTRVMEKDLAQFSSDACIWSYFTFGPTALLTLKSHAQSSLPPHYGGFVSTDDVLSAFIWQTVSRIRSMRYDADECDKSLPRPKSILSRNVDVRQYLGIPASYPGLVTNTTLHTCELDEVCEQTLGHIASQLRCALDPESLAKRTRELATQISHGKNARNSRFAPKGRLEFDIRLSSWAKEKCYSLDFGFGVPDAVRRPRFTNGAREGLVYFLPKSPDGEIVVGVCLKPVDMESLKKDNRLLKYSSLIE